MQSRDISLHASLTQFQFCRGNRHTCSWPSYIILCYLTMDTSFYGYLSEIGLDEDLINILKEQKVSILYTLKRFCRFIWNTRPYTVVTRGSKAMQMQSLDWQNSYSATAGGVATCLTRSEIKKFKLISPFPDVERHICFQGFTKFKKYFVAHHETVPQRSYCPLSKSGFPQ